MTLYQVFRLGSAFLSILRIAILVHVVMSWLQARSSFNLWLEGLVRPFVAPFRPLSRWLMARTHLPLDFSCWLAIIAISILDRVWWWIYAILRALR